MFHVELRQFPHNVNRFNLDQAGLWALLEPWVQERTVELGERRWSPQQATIKVIEGPEIPVRQLTMGRGWRAAQRQGTDATERVLAQARDAVAAGAGAAHAGAGAGAAGPGGAAPGAPQSSAPAPAGGLAAGVQLAGLLGADAVRLLAAWGEVAAGTSGLAPSESLALAERRLAGADGPPPSGGHGDG
jgi:hypothetical protein